MFYVWCEDERGARVRLLTTRLHQASPYTSQGAWKLYSCSLGKFSFRACCCQTVSCTLSMACARFSCVHKSLKAFFFFTNNPHYQPIHPIFSFYANFQRFVHLSLPQFSPYRHTSSLYTIHKGYQSIDQLLVCIRPMT